MTPGPATTKMIELVGREACQTAMQAYTQYMFANQDSGAETILSELAKILKGLHELQHRGYLTDEDELAVYGFLLEKLGVNEKPSLLFNLILKIHSIGKSGPKADYALGLLVFILKYFYNQRADNNKHFWPILTGFLSEQGIGIEDEHKKDDKDKISFEVLKSRYQYYNKRFMTYLKGIQEGSDDPTSTKSDHDFLVTFCLLVWIVWLQSNEKLSTKQRVEILKRTVLSSPSVRKHLKHNK